MNKEKDNKEEIKESDFIVIFSHLVDDSFTTAWLLSQHYRFWYTDDIPDDDDMENKSVILIKPKSVDLNDFKCCKSVLVLNNMPSSKEEESSFSFKEYLCNPVSFVPVIKCSVTMFMYEQLKPLDVDVKAIQLINQQVCGYNLDDPELKAFTLGLRHVERNFVRWDQYLNDVEHVITLGYDLIKLNQEIAQKAADQAVRVEINGYKGLLTESEPKYCNDIAKILSEKLQEDDCFIGIYEGPLSGKYYYSLRSASAFDVSIICSHFKGGGSSKAGGFSVDNLVHRVI
jgi:hypothetical protein